MICAFEIKILKIELILRLNIHVFYFITTIINYSVSVWFP